MRLFFVGSACLFMSFASYAQSINPLKTAGTRQTKANETKGPDSVENVYKIKENFLYNVLHNPNETEDDPDNDNELARFNRWFHDVEIRTYPSGNMPKPDVLLKATEEYYNSAARKGLKKTTSTPTWAPLGPSKVPSNFNGIGRINCVVIDPMDTNTLYVGAACGGVFISHDGGATWVSNSDNFPSLSIADIAVNPRHTDTIYAATGDGYGYENTSYSDFWGGLYSAGVMKSTDGGATWHTTGLSYLQTNREIIQRLLISPKDPNILLAATRNGLFRSTDAGDTWTKVDNGHIYSMAYRPLQPDTVYAVNTFDLKVSYDAGATWGQLSTGINPTNSRATLAVSPAAPNDIWLLDSHEDLHWSHNSGAGFAITNPPDTANFYGYYDRVLAVSPTDSNYILAFGSIMAVSTNAGNTWSKLNPPVNVHVDNHAVAINPLHPATIYTGNDGGISVTRNGGATWKNLGNGLMISQIYRMSSSRENPYIMICGLQDNGTFVYNGTNWFERTGGDGEDCAINPVDDYVQISSSQNGHFSISHDQGNSFAGIDVSTETADWTAPVAFDPNDPSTIYFGYKNIYVTHDGAGSFHSVTTAPLFPNGAKNLVVAPSTSNVLYASDFNHLYRSMNKGVTWTDVTGNLPVAYAATSRIAVDYNDSMKVYVSMSGYVSSAKVFVSTTGGTTWTSVGTGLPNLPVNCVAVDSSTPGAVFAGTDMGVFYTDNDHPGWSLYGGGLPNVMVYDLDVNYGIYKVRAATYGRGVWEADLTKPLPNRVPQVTAAQWGVDVYPNPTTDGWKIAFSKAHPGSYAIKVSDINGKTVAQLQNTDVIDATQLAPGTYQVEVTCGGTSTTLKAIKK